MYYINVYVECFVCCMSFDMVYGLVKINQIELSFDEIILNGCYIDFKLYMVFNSNCLLDLLGSYVDICLFFFGVKINYDVQNGNLYEVCGIMGNGGSSIIKVCMSYGGILVSRN